MVRRRLEKSHPMRPGTSEWVCIPGINLHHFPSATRLCSRLAIWRLYLISKWYPAQAAGYKTGFTLQRRTVNPPLSPVTLTMAQQNQGTLTFTTPFSDPHFNLSPHTFARDTLPFQNISFALDLSTDLLSHQTFTPRSFVKHHSPSLPTTHYSLRTSLSEELLRGERCWLPSPSPNGPGRTTMGNSSFPYHCRSPWSRRRYLPTILPVVHQQRMRLNVRSTLGVARGNVTVQLVVYSLLHHLFHFISVPLIHFIYSYPCFNCALLFTYTFHLLYLRLRTSLNHHAQPWWFHPTSYFLKV